MNKLSLWSLVPHVLPHWLDGHLTGLMLWLVCFLQCLKQYVELLIKEGLETAISCPDSACPKRGHLQETEVLLLFMLFMTFEKNIVWFSVLWSFPNNPTKSLTKEDFLYSTFQATYQIPH